MDPRREAILRFSRRPLKHPQSQMLLQELAKDEEILSRVVFVNNRDFLPNTLVIAEAGHAGAAFELELGVCQREEVSMVNGRLVRYTHRTRSRCVTDPVEALEALRGFKGRLYVMFLFNGDPPHWYVAVTEPNPALPLRHPSGDPTSLESIDQLMAEMVRQQIDLVILAVSLREEIDQALAERDEATFRARAPLYREVVQRCLWEL